jgi:XTP/dITP diphosphohydrolase
MLFVTSNPHKFQEARLVLGTSLRKAAYEYEELQADSLEAVVAYALERICQRYAPSEQFFVEDSGLFIDALNGFPGVYSKHVYFTIGCEGVLRVLAAQQQKRRRTATFLSVVGYCNPETGLRKVFVGRCRGTIAKAARGRYGFGFDPIFVPRGHRKTFAQMSRKEKTACSHRGKALNKLRIYLAGHK